MPTVKDLGDGTYEYLGSKFKVSNPAVAETVAKKLHIDLLTNQKARQEGKVNPSQMKKIRDLIMVEEGISYSPIIVKGNPTVGRGRDIKTKGFSPEETKALRLDQGRDMYQDPLNEYEVEMLFNRDVQDAAEQARMVVGPAFYDQMDDARRAVVTSMAFQMGQKGVAGFPSFLEALKRGDYERASQELLYKNPAVPSPEPSDWYTQTPNRAKKAADIIRTGEFPDSVGGGL